MKVTILTLGCRVNQSESAVIEGILKHNGVTIADLKENPDYCVINTCTVTARSDYSSRQLIRRAAKAGAKVIVTGCYSQLQEDKVRRLPGVWRVIDNRSKLDVLNEITDCKSRQSIAYHGRSRPHLKVQDGCNFRCSYCSVPLARGKSTSVAEESVIDSVMAIEAAGYQEVVLTGIHLGLYGYDLEKTASLKRLLRLILAKTLIKRIRLSSLEVSEIDDELMDLIMEERVCKHLHIPLQSGSERVLRMMNRRYSAKDFVSTIEKKVLKLRNVGLGTDIIAGFPGEDEEDFSDTLAVVRNLPFSYLHIFPFSPRPGTTAEKMEGRPDGRIVSGRTRRLADLGMAKKREFMSRQLSGLLDVIVEEADGTEFVGTSGNYLKVKAAMTPDKRGKLVFVRPTAVCGDVLRGDLIAPF